MSMKYGKPAHERWWRWKVTGAYNRYMIELVDDAEVGGSTYGNRLYPGTKKDAEEIAAALNAAYAEGIARGRSEMILESRQNP